MDEELRKHKQSLDEEVDLKALEMEALENTIFREKSNKPEIKFFRSYSRNGDCLPDLQKQINDFINENDIIDIQFQVQKTFLLGSTMGEYEENGYAMVIY